MYMKIEIGCSQKKKRAWGNSAGPCKTGSNLKAKHVASGSFSGSHGDLHPSDRKAQVVRPGKRPERADQGTGRILEIRTSARSRGSNPQTTVPNHQLMVT